MVCMVLDRLRNIRNFLDHGSGLLVLIFGMVALSSSVALMKTQDAYVENLNNRNITTREYLQKIYEFQVSVLFLKEEQSPQNLSILGLNLQSLEGAFQKFQKSASVSSVGKAMGASQILESSQKDISKIREIVDDIRKSSAESKVPIDHINEQGGEIISLTQQLSDSIRMLQNENAIDTALPDILESREEWLFWSVLVLGFSSFIMSVLYSDKLRKLKQVHEEKKHVLKLLENRLVAMEASRDGIAIISPEGHISYMNNAMLDIHGIPREAEDQFIGEDWTHLYTEDVQTLIREVIMPELKSVGFWQGDVSLKLEEDMVRYAEISLTKLPDGGFISTTRDVSDKNRIENEKKIFEEQFYQAQKMEAVGRLAGGIAHDFNNILAAMMGYAEFLDEDLPVDSEQRKFAQNILEAGAQARALVDQMLAFSRRKNSAKETIDILASVDNTVSMLKASLPKTIEVVKEFKEIQILVNANSSQMSQLMMNLCVNARDAMEGDRGQLTITADRINAKDFIIKSAIRDDLPDIQASPRMRIEDLEPGHTRLMLGHIAKNMDYAKIIISDTGSGMSRVIMEHIFEPFFTTKAVDKGTGLGLATVHGVLLGHQGAMIIDSILGKGTSFELYFPAEQGALDFKKRATNTASPKQTSQHLNKKILIVEDQDNVRDMMLSTLRRIGYEAQSCASGLDALDLIRSENGKFDLVITDHNMPKMTGLELVYQVHFDFPQIPFIVISGYSQQEMQDMIDHHPAIKAVLRKPISGQMLAQKMEAILGQEMKKNEDAA